MRKVILLAILIMVLNESASETPEIVIAVTPTKETIMESGFSTKYNMSYELKEYETTDNIVLSSLKTLNLNESSKVKGRIIGIENGKYVFSVEGVVHDLFGLSIIY